MRGRRKIAPGLVRLPMPPRQSGPAPAPGGLPLTLTLEESPDGHAVGLMAPTTKPPWGCLFFSILGLALIVSIFSRNWAVIGGTLALIVYYAFYNHPRRVKAEALQRAYSLLGMRKTERASQVLERVLGQGWGEEGANYLATLVELDRGRPAQALDRLEQARPKMAVYAEFHHLEGRCFRDLGRGEEAREAYGRALRYPDYPHLELAREELAAMGGQPTI